MEKEYYIFRINLKKLNIIANIIFILLFAALLLFFTNIIIGFYKYSENLSFCLLILPIMILYFGLHEIFHAFGYLLYGANLKKLTFGMELEKGIFYCLCKQDVSRKTILHSVLFPLFYLGVVTLIIGIIFKLPLLSILSILNISGATADIMYFLFIIRLPKDIKFSELDDGVAFAILSDIDVSKVKHFGLDFIEKKKEIERKDFKRIKVSKLSYIVLFITLILCIVGILI